MIDRIAKLEAALRVNVARRAQAERLAAAYIARDFDRDAIISELIKLLHGPGQREAKRLAEVALDEARGGEEEASALTPELSNASFGVRVERLIAAYTAPESYRGAIINELIAPLRRAGAARG